MPFNCRAAAAFYATNGDHVNQLRFLSCLQLLKNSSVMKSPELLGLFDTAEWTAAGGGVPGNSREGGVPLGSRGGC